MALLCSINTDNTFGPAINASCRGGFDFTLLFEQSILGILPAGAFFIAFPVVFCPLALRRARTEHNLFRVLKIVCAILYVAIQSALLVLWAREKQNQTKVSIPLAAINLLVAIQLVALSWIEDARSVKPSSLLVIYLLFTLLFDVAQARTLWLQDAQSITSMPAVFTAAVGIKTVFLLLEMQEKRRYLKPAYRDLPPESTSGVVNRSLMWWINNLLWRGFCSLLTLQDLYGLDEDLGSAKLEDKVRSAWERRRKPERSCEFAWKACQAMRWSILSAVFPRLCLIGFTFSQPFLISAILKWVQQDNASKDDGYKLIGATILVYLGLAVSTIHYNHKLYRFITMFRGATVSLIYRHTLLLQDTDLPDRSAAITLMSSDIDRISASLVNLNEIWARSMEVVVGVIVLAYQIGWVCVMPIIIIVASSVGCTQVTKRIGGRQKIWIDAVQERIAITSSILTDIKSVRMMGLSQHFTEVIQRMRISETHRMAGFRWSIVWQNIIQNLPWAMAPALSFIIFVGLGNSINPSKVFTSLSVITLLTNPAAKLLSAIPSTAASLGCFTRIQAFLSTEPSESSTADSTDDTSSSDSFKIGEFSKGVAISMSDAHISPITRANHILKNVNMEIPFGSFVIFYGPVASGKTTLLRTILGKCSPQEGSIFVAHDRIGYCSQSPWLPNTTIREAICGITDTEKSDGKSIDIEFYRTVLQACALEKDIDLLPKGDETCIGTGCNAMLSGGQIHRVALARAIYSRSQIVLLDDVLSALDPKTVSIIMQKVFGSEGLFKKLNTTVILVTREVALFSRADMVYRISDGSVHKILPDEHFPHTKQPSIFTDANKRKSQDEKGNSKTDAAKAAAADDNLRDLTRATGDWGVYKYYIRSIGWWKLSIFISFVIVNVFCSTFSQIWLKWWADRNGDQKALFVSVYFVLAILNSIGNGGYVWAIMVLIAPSTARKLHYTLLRTVMRAPQSYLSATDSGIILNRFSQDMSLIEGQLAIGVLVTVSNLFTCIATAALIATGSSYMGITTLFLIIAVFILQHFYLRTSRQLRLLDLETKSPLYSHFLESINGLTTIQAFGWQQKFIEKNHKLLDNSQRPYYLLYCIQRWLTLVLDLIVAAEAVILVCMAITLRGSSNVGLLGVSLNNILSFSTSLSSLISGWTLLEISLGSIARVKNLETEVRPEETDGEKNEPSPNWADRGVISFRGVTASHSPGNTALHDVSFDIQSGQKIGICGRTGSGKSSLLGTLLGILEMDQGHVFIDDLDLKSIPRETIRKKLITIPQFPLLVSTTSVRSNADPESLHSDTEIIAALEKVQLWEKLKTQGGLDSTSVISSLSRGEQQLFAVARALLKVQAGNSRIVLLDEATSSIDLETERIVKQILREEPFASCSILMIAHSLATMQGCDIIVVMDEGRILDMGSPSDLLQKKDSALSFLNLRD